MGGCLVFEIYTFLNASGKCLNDVKHLPKTSIPFIPKMSNLLIKLASFLLNIDGRDNVRG